MQALGELIPWADAEETLRLFYEAVVIPSDERWEGATSVTKVPDPRPPMFIRVMRSGGTVNGLVVDRPTLVTEAWAPTEELAIALLQSCRTYLFAAGRAGVLGDVTIYDDIVEYSGPQNLPDPRTGQYRYTMTDEIPMRALAPAVE